MQTVTIVINESTQDSIVLVGGCNEKNLIKKHFKKTRPELTDYGYHFRYKGADYRAIKANHYVY
jgi:hypothetical protein